MRSREMSNRLQLQDLIVRYCVAIDDRNLDSLSELFHPNATFSAVGEPPKGRSAIKKYYGDRLAAYGMTYHYPHGVTFSNVKKSTASGIVLAHAELSIDGVLFKVAMRYYDDYVVYRGSWVFKERQLKQFYALPLDELARGVGLEHRVRWPKSAPEPALLPESLKTWSTWATTALA